MKNIEILDLASMLSTYAKDLKNLKGAKFGYALLKNIDKLTAECKLIEEARGIPEKFKEYETKRIALCEKYADKDETGQPQKKQYSATSFEYIINPDNIQFISEVETLKNEYTQAIEEFAKTEEDYKTLLNSENNDFKLTLITFDCVPEDISVELLSVIKSFIKDEELA